jgi:hypothetical protein
MVVATDAMWPGRNAYIIVAIDVDGQEVDFAGKSSVRDQQVDIVAIDIVGNEP